MPIYALGSIEPRIDASAYIHPEAVIIGEVTIGADSSVWPCAVLRGDDGQIIIGRGSSVQDGAVLHCTPELPTVIGDECTIGHNAHLEGCRILDGGLVGSGAVVLHEAEVGEWALVGAGAVVTGGTVVPAGALALGTPAKIREGLADKEDIYDGMLTYIERAKRFRSELRRLD